MMLDPDPLYVGERSRWARTAREAYREGWDKGFDSAAEVALSAPRGRSIPRWYLLASFVTGLLLGAAVARL